MPEPLVPGAAPPAHPRPPYWRDSTSTLYVGDARDVLSEMAAGSADCMVTSPPYWGKRDYGVAGQYGHEPGPDAYVETLRATFVEAWRVWPTTGPAGSTSVIPTPPAEAPQPASTLISAAT